MPRKNTVRNDEADSFYHVYNRGHNKSEIFLDDSDYRYFEMLLARSLSSKKSFDKFSRQYSNFNGEVQIHAYCLMSNHFHLLLYQKEQKQIEKFMRSILTAYTMYFNRKYDRSGSLYESMYKSVLIKNDEQLRHISRYIHLNPINYRVWDYGSYSDYMYGTRDWVTTDKILKIFKTPKLYADFVDDYVDVKQANNQYSKEIGDI